MLDSMMAYSPERHVGDGISVTFDGYFIYLHIKVDGDCHRIHLRPSTYAALADYIASVKKQPEHEASMISEA